MSKYDNLRRDAGAAQAEFGRVVSATRDDPGLSPVGRQQRIARAWLETTAELQRLSDGFRQEVDERRRDLERRLFGRPEGVDARDYRDALERVEQLDGEEAAMSMLDRARRTGDDTLAQAVVAVGAERGWGQAVDAWTADHPARAETLGELVGMNEALRDPHVQLELSALASISWMRPPELAHLSDSELAAVADAG